METDATTTVIKTYWTGADQAALHADEDAFYNSPENQDAIILRAAYGMDRATLQMLRAQSPGYLTRVAKSNLQCVVQHDAMAKNYNVLLQERQTIHLLFVDCRALIFNVFLSPVVPKLIRQAAAVLVKRLDAVIAPDGPDGKDGENHA